MTAPDATSGTAPATRPPNRVLVEWRGSERFDAHRPEGPPIRIDGEWKTGPGPVDTLLAALVACTTGDVVNILAKRRTPPESIVVEAIGTRVETTPRRLTHILLKYNIGGAGIEHVHADRAVELAITKYCSIRDSLDPNIPIEWEVTVSDSAVDRNAAPSPSPDGRVPSPDP